MPKPYDGQNWYDTRVWRRKRKLQLLAEPICRMCLADGVVCPASSVDHVVPHKGDYQLFRLGELQSLCAGCHDRRKQRIEVIGYEPTIDVNGWPIDPRHPSYQSRAVRVGRKQSGKPQDRKHSSTTLLIEAISKA